MFSVIVPTYNRANHLRNCLNSLVDQTFKQFEVLICDDGSTDNTVEVIQEYHDKLDIKYYYHENSGGPAKPRNTGILNSSFEWLCFLDADDQWYANKLEKLSEWISSVPADIFCHQLDVLDESGNRKGRIGRYKRNLFSNDFVTLLYNGGGIANSSLCVRKSLISEEFIFDTSPEYHGIEDFIFLLKLTHNNAKVFASSEVLGIYQIHAGNISAEVSKQILKWKSFFNTRPFKNVDYEKIDSFILYIEVVYSKKYSFKDKIIILSRILLKYRASLNIKIKSVVRLADEFLRYNHV